MSDLILVETLERGIAVGDAEPARSSQCAQHRLARAALCRDRAAGKRSQRSAS